MPLIDFFRPKWKHSDWNVRMAAVRTLGDQKALAMVARTDGQWRVREAATRILTDQAVLAQVALKERVGYVRQAAVEKIKDQAVLAQIAKSDLNSDVRRLAVERVTDQNVLGEVARRDRNKYVQKVAISMLTDQSALADVAKYAPWRDVCDAAIGKLTSQSHIASVAEHANGLYNCEAAIKKLTSQTALAEVAESASLHEIRRLAVEKLTSQTAIAKVAKNASDKDVSRVAVDKLTDRVALVDVAETASDSSVRQAAADKLADRERLAQVGTPSFAEIAKNWVEYTNQKWGFKLRHPETWTIGSNEHVEGEWTKPVVFAQSEGGERVAAIIISIGAMHTGGTIGQYIDKARGDLSRAFREFTLISCTEQSVNNLPTAWMHYRFVERGAKNEEYNITFFLGDDPGVPFQIVCFTDIDRFARLREEFRAIIQSVAFINNQFWLPHISLYGKGAMVCQSCGRGTATDAALALIQFPANKMRVICNDCRGAG